MKRLTAITLIAIFSAVSAAYADPVPIAPGIRASIEKVRFRDDGNARRYFVVQQARGRNTTAQKASAAIALGFLGGLTGGWVGAYLQPNCACQDQGLQGALIGMPVGAAVGAVAGWWLASR